MLANAEKSDDRREFALHDSRREELIGHIARLTQRLDELDNLSGEHAPATRQLLYMNARIWLQKQNARQKYLPKNIFRDPAWNILIDMYVQEREGRTVSVTSACVASGAPSSTALRWISSLEGAGLISRLSDALDGRRTFLRLTPNACNAIERWLLEPG